MNSFRFLAIKIKLKEGQVAKAVRLSKYIGHTVNFAFQINNKFFLVYLSIPNIGFNWEFFIDLQVDQN